MPFLTFSILALYSGLLVLIIKNVRQKTQKLPCGAKELPGPKGFPLLGCVPYLPSKHKWLQFHSWAQKHGPIYQVNLAGNNIVMVSSPIIADDLLVKRQDIYSSRPRFPAILPDNQTSMHYLPLLANGADHQRAKLFAKRLMASTSRTSLVENTAGQTKSLILKLLETPCNFQRLLEQCTSGISSQSAWDNNDTAVALETLARANELVIGISPEALENKFKFLTSIPEWVPNFLQPWKVNELKRLYDERAFWFGQQDRVYQQIREKQADKSWCHEAFKLKGSLMNHDEAAYSVGMLALIGGMLVSSPIQSWFLAMCHYPEWQTKGQAEVDLVCGDRMPTVEDIQHMPLVRAIIRETFRWRSTVPYGVPHLVEEDDVYDGYFIPKGTHVFALEWSLNRDEKLYPDPESFNPERWLQSSYATYKEPLTQFPQIKNHSGFGWGRRACIGQDYSELVVFTIVASILWSCVIEKKRDLKTKQIIETPWLDYGPFAIVRPNHWDLEIKPRSESRIQTLRKNPILETQMEQKNQG